MIGAAVGFGVVEIVAGLMPTYARVRAARPVIGLSSLTMLNSANATMQLSVRPAMRGRVMALYMMTFMGGTPIGSPLIGWLAETFGARWTLHRRRRRCASAASRCSRCCALIQRGAQRPAAVPAWSRSTSRGPARAGSTIDGRVRA